MLIEASQDPNGKVYRLRTMHGLSIQTNATEIVASQEPRTTARWESALKELREGRFLEDRGRKAELFAVTDEGYRVADLLKEKTLVPCH